MNHEAFKRTLDCLAAAPYVAVDTEANGGDIRDERGFAMGVSVACRMGTGGPIISAYFPFRHETDNLPSHYVSELGEVLANHNCLVFHNAKFDIVSLGTLGIDITGKFYDTMLMAHMVDENLTSKGLDFLAKTLLKEAGKNNDHVKGWAKAWGWHTIPAQMMAPYAKNDAEMTLRLFEHLFPNFEEQGFNGELWDIEQEFTRLLIKMEGRGIKIDANLCRAQAEHGRQRMAMLTEELGANPASPLDLADLLITELGLPVHKTTPQGKPCFDKEAMAKYEENLVEIDSPIAKQVLEYRGWQKAVSASYEAYLNLVSPDGRVRPNYKIHGTTTGRLSCEAPNLQQIPRVSDKPWNGNLKSAFVPQEGYELWEADYGQLEFRLGAAYAQEEDLLAAFSDPERDVFTEMAAELGMPRQDVKTLTYTLQYGGGVNRLSTVFRVSPDRASQIRDDYFSRYPGFKRATTNAATAVKRRGYVKYWTGRRRHFQYGEDESHKAFNAVIQGGAAEIVKRTMLRLSEEVDGPDCRMLLQVHDSVVFEILSDRVDEYTQRIRKVMEAVEPDFGVRFVVDVHPWGK